VDPLVTAPYLVADCVSKRFGERRVLTSGSLRAEPGQVRVILGRNGVGKSTLLKIAVGLVRADSGVVHVAGVPLLAPTLPRLAHAGVFYLPDHELLSATMTLGAQLRLFERRFGRRTAIEAARLARVEEFMDALPSSLSGGELRRAELALALVRRPHCLLADEPFRGIAPIDQESLGSLVRDMAADGCAVVVTGHEVGALMAVADHVTWCTSGTTYELGTPREARAHEALAREYPV
jgi:ABC-type multidrug transport system ATPase subunit